MKLKKEFKNGYLIFIGVGTYFLLIDFLGFSDNFYLRLLNVLIVFYGVNRTIETRIAQGKTEFVPNVVSAMTTSIVGVTLSVLGLIIYSYMKGGDAYVQSLSQTFLFGGNPSIVTYSICLFFEGIASSVIVTMLLMLYWNNRFVAD